MLSIYRVLAIKWDGEEVLQRAFLSNEKAQSYARECRGLNKVEKIIIREEKAHQ